MDEHEREQAIGELAERDVVYRLPAADTVQSQRLSYRSTTGSELPMVVFAPPGVRRPAPAVVVTLGYVDPLGRVLNFRPVTSWARLLAASGIAAVVYSATSPADDVDAVLRQLRREAGALKLDMERIGLFATSGSVPVALATLMRDPAIRCAALLYGYTMDLDGSTAVEDMARETGFANACAGRTVDHLPEAVPMLFVRAGKDQFPSLNGLLDRVVARAIMRNLPVAVVNHPTGVHGFDIYDEGVQSLRTIQHVLAFLQIHLSA